MYRERAGSRKGTWRISPSDRKSRSASRVPAPPDILPSPRLEPPLEGLSPGFRAGRIGLDRESGLHARQQKLRRKFQPTPISIPTGATTEPTGDPEGHADDFCGGIDLELHRHIILLQSMPSPPNWVPPWSKPESVSSSDVPTLSCRSDAFCDAATNSSSKSPSRRLRESQGGHRLLSGILNRLLPLNSKVAASSVSSQQSPSKTSLDMLQSSPVPADETLQICECTPENSPHSVATPDGDMVGVLAFKSALVQSFGNVKRAFKAIKHAVQSAELGESQSASHGGLPGSGLTRAEFEWCFTSFLHLGDSRLAQRLFKALANVSTGEVGLVELTDYKTESLFSLVELRRFLLDRYGSLKHAFRALEDAWLPQHGSRKGCRDMAINEQQFREAAKIFGLETCQSSHFFRLLDVNGDRTLTFTEFLDALVSMPQDVLLQDFRQRLLSQHATIADALRGLIVHSPSSGAFSPGAFIDCMAKFQISESEAQELFRILDSDESGKITSDELREAIRSVAPSITLQGFWQRMAAEWPEIVEAARECSDPSKSWSARCRVGGLLFELLPQQLREQTPRLKSGLKQEQGRTKLLQAPGCLHSVSLDAFDALAALLDVSSQNARELYFQILGMVSPHPSWQHEERASTASGRSEDCRDDLEEIFLEDFAEHLRLWTEDAMDLSVTRAGRTYSLRQIVAPAKAAISALTKELSPPVEPSKIKPVPPPKESKTKRRSINLPWRTHYPCMQSITPVFIG
eukprot:TRINITY_DN29999_c0_g2_i1.p1 TRINITY_DN29999_c0_g2~~TRINITY_DN29999_c0_g2_i1.p1  ORF type:complete len:746 (+),score=95.27 TRINITY_DN29999_c0_g2_i1:71-2308(+)